MADKMNYFDARYAAMLKAAGIADPDDPRRVDVHNAFVAELEGEGLKDAYLRQVFRDLANAGLIDAPPLNRRQRRGSR